MSILVEVKNDGNLARLQLPTAFTPNGDGLNDCFGIGLWGEEVKMIDFKIYNRWGQLVFDGSKRVQCWDGTFRGGLQPNGLYIYKLRAESFCGLIERNGTVHLIR